MSSKKSGDTTWLRGAKDDVIFLNPQTCGIYKNGGVRFKVDARTGRRTTEVDNELAKAVDDYLARKQSPLITRRSARKVFEHEVLVPRYFDDRWNADMRVFCAEHEVETASLDDLITEGVIHVTGGHGSPSNDQRTGDIPYVKVSDVRSLRVNVNPTNLVSRVVAESFWGASASGLAGWDLVTPNRASSNIGEFAILLPGEEQIVLTKEVFVIRVVSGSEAGWDPFYLLWAFCLRAVRRQWQRVTLMQTNREDVGDRFREVLVPRPKSKEWATSVSAPFRNYFTTLATAKAAFVEKVRASKFDFIANVKTAGVIPETAATDDQTPVTDQPSA